jgi:hypothetical protein
MRPMRATTALVAALTAVLAAFAVAAPRAFADEQPLPPTYIWNGHGDSQVNVGWHTAHPPSSLRLGGGVLLTNIEWWVEMSQMGGTALVSPSHWYRTDVDVDSFRHMRGRQARVRAHGPRESAPACSN